MIKKGIYPSKRAVVLTIALLLPLLMKAQDRTLIVVEHADSLEFNADIDARAERLLGNVRVTHNGAVVHCDSAYIYGEDNTLKAFGNIHVNRGDTLELFGDILNYNGNSSLADVQGNVILKDTRLTLTTDRLDYDMVSDIGYYDDGGTVADSSNVLTSITGRYYSQTDLVFFKDEVIVEGTDYFLYTDTLEYNTVSKMVYVDGPTDFETKDSTSTLYTEKGWFDTQSNVLHLTQRSIYRGESQKLYGDTIHYEKLFGVGDAFSNVRLLDEGNKIEITGDRGQYSEMTDRAFITKRATFVQFMKTDTLYMHADTLMSIVDERYLAKDSLEMEGVPILSESQSTIDYLKGSDSSINIDTISSRLSTLVSDSLASMVLESLHGDSALLKDTLNRVLSDTLSNPLVDILSDTLSNPLVDILSDTLSNPLVDILSDTLSNPLVDILSDTLSNPLVDILSDTLSNPLVDILSDTLSDTLSNPLESVDSAVVDNTVLSGVLTEKLLEVLPDSTVIDLLQSFGVEKRPLDRELLLTDVVVEDTLLNSLESVSDSLSISTALSTDTLSTTELILTDSISTKPLVSLPDSISNNLPLDMPDSLSNGLSNGLLSPASDTLFVEDKESEEIPRVFKAFRGVRYFKSDMQGKCDSLMYSTNDSITKMYYEPVVWTQNNQLMGEEIEVINNAEDPDIVNLYTNAFVISQQSEKMFNQVKGKKMKGLIANGSIYEIEVKGNGRSIYYAQDETGTVGVNIAESSDIILYLKDQKIETINFINNPSMDFSPPTWIDEEQSKLEKFTWLEDIRPKSKDEIYLDLSDSLDVEVTAEIDSEEMISRVDSLVKSLDLDVSELATMSEDEIAQTVIGKIMGSGSLSSFGDISQGLGSIKNINMNSIKLSEMKHLLKGGGGGSSKSDSILSSYGLSSEVLQGVIFNMMQSGQGVGIDSEKLKDLSDINLDSLNIDSINLDSLNLDPSTIDPSIINKVDADSIDLNGVDIQQGVDILKRGADKLLK